MRPATGGPIAPVSSISTAADVAEACTLAEGTFDMLEAVSVSARFSSGRNPEQF